MDDINRASDPSQVPGDVRRRDVVGEVVVEGDVEDGHREECGCVRVGVHSLRCHIHLALRNQS